MSALEKCRAPLGAGVCNTAVELKLSVSCDDNYIPGRFFVDCHGCKYDGLYAGDTNKEVAIGKWNRMQTDRIKAALWDEATNGAWLSVKDEARIRSIVGELA